ncbi:MAG TPA: lipoyl(octanoyl) transferase LipB [Chitinophagaceae bacterium]|nr:lipoyl(octanoyl) transferase LipB [Chitinophagaceae bacterium]
MDLQTVMFRDLGSMSYRAAWEYQEQLLQHNVQLKTAAMNRANDSAHNDEYTAGPYTVVPVVTGPAQTTHHLLFVEHPPVYTIGKSGNEKHFLINEEECRRRNIEYFKTNRGGDITFHGPGQIVGYPILDLEHFYTDIGRYLRELEEVIILTLAEYGIKGDRSPGETGVWIDPQVKGKERKICAMGVRCSRWITMHGFAFNVNTDLAYFNYIVPCGIQGKQVTSLQKELGRRPDMNEVKDKVKNNFEKVFNARLKDS